MQKALKIICYKPFCSYLTKNGDKCYNIATVYILPGDIHHSRQRPICALHLKMYYTNISGPVEIVNA